MINVKVKLLHPDAKFPVYSTEGAACFDLSTLFGEHICGGDSQLFRTGMKFEIPDGFAMLIYGRSGHAIRNGIRLSNCTAVIDSDYRGEVMVKLHNDSKCGIGIAAGERICQAMIVPVSQVKFDEVSQLSRTKRGNGGFGSTGA